jgi:hypothetical protein
MKTRKKGSSAAELWGQSPSWREAQARTRGFGASDWLAVKAEMGALTAAIAAAMDEGAESAAAQAGVSAYHDFIDKTFYTCSAAMFEGLSGLWAEDERFGAHFEAVRPGLTAFLVEAVHVYVESLLLVGEQTRG